MRNRNVIAIAILIFAAFGLLVITCNVALPDGPAAETTRRPLDLPSLPEGTPEPPSRGVGVLDACSLPPGIGDAEDFPGSFREFDPFDMEDYQVIPGCNFLNDTISPACEYYQGGWPLIVGRFGSSTTHYSGGVKIDPDTYWLVSDVEVYVAVDSELKRPSGDITLTILEGELITSTTVAATSAVSATLIPVEPSSNVFQMYSPTTFEFDPPVVLNSGTSYWFVFSADEQSSTGKWAFVTGANWNNSGTAWVAYETEPWDVSYPYDCLDYDNSPAWLASHIWSIRQEPGGTPTVFPDDPPRDGSLVLGINGVEVTPTPTSGGGGATATPTPVPPTTPTPVPPTTPTVPVTQSTPQTQDIIAEEDTFICETQPDTNFGNNSILALNDGCKVMIRWPNIRGTLFGQTVTAATLRLFSLAQPVTSDGSTTFSAHVVIPQWRELTPTWNVSMSGDSWASPGASTAGTDYVSSAVGTIPVTGSTFGWIDVPLSVTAVNNWIMGVTGNYGVIIRSGTVNNDLRLTSSEWYDEGFRPRLILTTLASTPTPTP